MPSLLSVIGLAAVLAVGAAAGLEADRLPPLGVTLPIPFWHPRLELPYVSLATQRDAAVSATRIAEEASKTCRATLTLQSTENSREAALSASVLADTKKALSQGQAAVADLRRRASNLKDYVPVGPDVCARWTDADHIVQMMLGGPGT